MVGFVGAILGVEFYDASTPLRWLILRRYVSTRVTIRHVTAFSLSPPLSLFLSLCLCFRRFVTLCFPSTAPRVCIRVYTVFARTRFHLSIQSKSPSLIYPRKDGN